MNQKINEIILQASHLIKHSKWEEAIEIIYQGIQYDSRNHELYFMLAQCKEMLGARQQAVLSYENALFYASGKDYCIIKECYQSFLATFYPPLEKCRNVSFILVTYNQLEMTQLCIQSIRQNCPSGSYEIVAVDNLSTDGTREWLTEQKDIRSVLNEKNCGFPAACNQGADLAEDGNDIFLLNNDTVITENSVYNLRMALYDSENIGAVGACSNNVSNMQQIEEKFDSFDAYIQYAEKNNAYTPEKHEKRLRLIGFAMILKRSVWEQVKGFDERYGIGNYEDDDISLKILKQGMNLVFCRDSFIFHFGGASFDTLNSEKRNEYHQILQTNKKIFEEKWKITWEDFFCTQHNLIHHIEEDKNKQFSILEIGCSSGAGLLELQKHYPHARLYGIDSNQDMVNIASHYLNIVQWDASEKKNPFKKHYDYIIMQDILAVLQNPADVLKELKTWLKPEGHLILNAPNMMHISIIEPLLHGRNTYQEDGTPSGNTRTFFTKSKLIELMGDCGLTITQIGGYTINLSQAEEQYIEKLCKMDALIPKEELQIFQYWLKAAIS